MKAFVWGVVFAVKSLSSGVWSTLKTMLDNMSES
jgi:hypothetical protein